MRFSPVLIGTFFLHFQTRGSRATKALFELRRNQKSKKTKQSEAPINIGHGASQENCTSHLKISNDSIQPHSSFPCRAMQKT
jgi:hypothetical protein